MWSPAVRGITVVLVPHRSFLSSRRRRGLKEENMEAAEVKKKSYMAAAAVLEKWPADIALQAT
jgi:hypothetical protein